ncbi:MAG: hypothetical protein IT435_05435 [Phycisphaerales bacterium]|nr:hypothetical protein [Phycisphaerales bacterium]
MAKKSKKKKANKHRSLTQEIVESLGAFLVELADKYPLTFLTERDFYPAVIAYLYQLVPGVTTESVVDKGKVDFRTGGPNPGLLELAVAPRMLQDHDDPTMPFPGHGEATQLYAVQNKPELAKLTAVPQAQAKNRYLLLLDIQKKHEFDKLKTQYLKELPRDGKSFAVQVCYVKRGNDPNTFQVGGKQKGAKKKSKKT